MNQFANRLAWLIETPIFGSIYSAAQRRIRHPAPLDPDENWAALTAPTSPAQRWIRNHYPPAIFRTAYLHAKFRLDHFIGIAAHYDTSNAFYELFLDKKFMFYSGADFKSPDDTLEHAQTRKADFMLDLIAPEPGQRVLDLGCGWGGMMNHIRQHTGDKDNLFGYTLSKEQLAHVTQRYGFNVTYRDFITADYRSAEFDRIYSIGAWEHVRPREIPPLLAKLFRALKPGGRLVQQFICFPSDRPSPYAVGAQLYFPGSNLSPYDFQIQSAEAAGFRITHQSIHDYRLTLKAWYDNLAAHRDQAIDRVGLRTYNKYMVFFPIAWTFHHDREGILLRIALQKP
jgi:cyclopropane-fatty-acyl-phospholipid synthase